MFYVITELLLWHREGRDESNDAMKVIFMVDIVSLFSEVIGLRTYIHDWIIIMIWVVLLSL